MTKFTAVRERLPMATVALAQEKGMVIYPETINFVPNAGDFVASELSSYLNCSALLAEVDQQETLRLRLFDAGQPVDEYKTEPGLWIGEDLPPSGGNAARLLLAFDRYDVETQDYLSRLLQAGRYDDEFGFTQAVQRHEEIAELLDLPETVGISYEAIQHGILPEGYNADQLSTVYPFPETELRQYTLLRPPFPASEEDIATYLLLDIFSLELGTEKEEWKSNLGTPFEIHTAIQLAGLETQPFAESWLSIRPAAGDCLLHLDCGTNLSQETVETAQLFLSFPTGQTEGKNLLHRLAQAIKAIVWDVRTRQIVARSAAL